MREILRQLFHALIGVLLYTLILITPPIFFQSFAIGLLLALIYLKLLIKRGYKIPIINDYIKTMGRVNELGEGSFYFLLGALIVSLFFEPLIAAVSVLVLGVSDAASTIIGVKFGRHKIYKKKSLEGSTAFFITSFLIINYYFGLITGIISGLLLSLIELYSGFDDNVIIPPACALIIALSRVF